MNIRLSSPVISELFGQVVKEAQSRLTPLQMAHRYRRIRRAQEIDIKHVHMPHSFAEAHDPWRQDIEPHVHAIMQEQLERKSYY